MCREASAGRPRAHLITREILDIIKTVHVAKGVTDSLYGSGSTSHVRAPKLTPSARSAMSNAPRPSKNLRTSAGSVQGRRHGRGDRYPDVAAAGSRWGVA